MFEIQVPTVGMRILVEGAYRTRAALKPEIRPHYRDPLMLDPCFATYCYC